MEVKTMATLEFVYEDPFPLGKDDTEYRVALRAITCLFHGSTVKRF